MGESLLVAVLLCDDRSWKASRVLCVSAHGTFFSGTANDVAHQQQHHPWAKPMDPQDQFHLVPEGPKQKTMDHPRLIHP